ncbi:MAG: polyprenyl synthetase family protein [Chloroflexi bacterium]|nr:MAG: polyprenyl synthetase family protein [Chloroflexota bacterium]
MIKTVNTTLTVLDPLPGRLVQVEALLAERVDASRSPLEAALAQLIAAGGKRIRPRLALLTGGLLGVDPGPLIHLAAAVEMLHTASLVHDDLVDGAGLRRGVETLNARWSSAASVLVGDFAFTQAAQLALATRCLPAIDLFTESMRRMVDGELAQLARPRGITSREEYFDWIAAKTAALFELATGAPALLAEAPGEIVSVARSFGAAIGMAFQIMDDVLDFTGQTSSLGKPAGQDLRQGLLTLPALLHLESHPDDPGLRRLVERQLLPEAEVERTVIALREGGAVGASVEIARGFVARGLEALSRLPEGPERLALAEIVDAIINREK